MSRKMPDYWYLPHITSVMRKRAREYARAVPPFDMQIARIMARSMGMIPVAETIVPQEWLEPLRRQYYAAALAMEIARG